LLGWVLSSIGAIYDRLAPVSTNLAAVMVGALLLALIVLAMFGVHFLWTAMRADRRARREPVVSRDPAAAAQQSIEAAQKQIEQVRDEVARRALSQDLQAIESDLAESRFTIVVFGTGSSGKTSVINALLGGKAGPTDVLVGTTKESEEHAYTLQAGGGGSLRLIDTPGLSEIGPSGLMREERARELATQADLLLFVVDQDLRDIEFGPLMSLARLGKKSLIAFNKRDLYSESEANEIAARLRQRICDTKVEAEVVICAAAPAPVKLRGGGEAQMHAPPAEVSELANAIAETLQREGRLLLAQNVLLRTAQVSNKARDSIHQARRDAARRIVTRFQWTTAGVMFVNPVPGLGALAAAAINYQMVMEIAKTFNVTITTGAARKMAGELAQVLVKMGVVNVAVDILGKSLKATVVGYIAGGAIEAVTGAYLTRISGDAFTDYFAHDQNWGDGGMQGAIERRFKLAGQREFIAQFIKEASERMLSRSGTQTPDA
jgi:GTPase SAR1 family protein